MATQITLSNTELVSLPTEILAGIVSHLDLPNGLRLACTCQTFLNLTVASTHYWKEIVRGLGLALPQDPAQYRETAKNFYIRFNQLVQSAGITTSAQTIYGKYRAHITSLTDNKELRAQVVVASVLAIHTQGLQALQIQAQDEQLESVLEQMECFFKVVLLCQANQFPEDLRNLCGGLAATAGRVDILVKLLQVGPISQETRSMYLSIVAKSRSVDAMLALLQSGPVDPSVCGNALIDATRARRLDMVLALIQHGNVDRDKAGEAVFIAVHKNYMDILHALLRSELIDQNWRD